MENVRLVISICDVTIISLATTPMRVNTRASQPVYEHGIVHDTTRFGPAMFDKYVYVVTFIELTGCKHNI